MAVQMYLVQPRNSGDERMREAIAEFIAWHSGFILMATSYGSIIAALDEVYVDKLKSHPEVDFVGGVTLNPEGRAAAELQQLFAHNVALQLAARATPQPEPAPAADPPTSAYRTGHRPLRPEWDAQRLEAGGSSIEHEGRTSWLPRFR
jgi:hypothetical protein